MGSEPKVFVGSLSYNTDDHGLKNKFSEFGNVQDAVIIKDRETGRSRGFGFVTVRKIQTFNYYDSTTCYMKC